MSYLARTWSAGFLNGAVLSGPHTTHHKKKKGVSMIGTREHLLGVAVAVFVSSPEGAGPGGSEGQVENGV